MWIGHLASVDWIRNVLGVGSFAQIDIDKTRLQDLNNPLSARIQAIVSSIRAKRRRHMKVIKCYIIEVMENFSVWLFTCQEIIYSILTDFRLLDLHF